MSNAARNEQQQQAKTIIEEHDGTSVATFSTDVTMIATNRKTMNTGSNIAQHDPALGQWLELRMELNDDAMLKHIMEMLVYGVRRGNPETCRQFLIVSLKLLMQKRKAKKWARFLLSVAQSAPHLLDEFNANLANPPTEVAHGEVEEMVSDLTVEPTAVEPTYRPLPDELNPPVPSGETSVVDSTGHCSASGPLSAYEQSSA